LFTFSGELQNTKELLVIFDLRKDIGMAHKKLPRAAAALI
jgi:hypothetical protein